MKKSDQIFTQLQPCPARQTFSRIDL